MVKLILILFIIAVIVGGVVLFMPKTETEIGQKAQKQSEGAGDMMNEEEMMDKDNMMNGETMMESGKNIVLYTEDGYSPNPLEIKRSDTVIFRNQNPNKKMWTASAVHPTHTVYPNSSINKCGTAQANSIFDMCEGADNGEEWPFAFNETGEWDYHNHLSPGHTGKIIVK